MAASYGSGGQSPPVIGRPVERVFEDAQFTGEINLSGRKLKDYPKFCSKYDLADTIHTDLSKNRFGEVPPEVCEYSSMERLNCYHNIIKSIPEAIIQLQTLTHLNLSRNQLTVLPVSLCALTSLEVLLASNNKLVSLPEEIGKLDRLMDLDVSCNEISHLPPQIGDLCSLRSLNLRRNLLVELPFDICKLNLRKLDISSNRIEKIPTVFRKLEMLEVIVLEHNPLSSPPAHICTRGRQHIMKYLHTEAIKEDRKRGILSDTDMKRLIRKSLPPQHRQFHKTQRTSDEFRNILESPESKWKRHTVLSSDSGYSTADSLDKCGWNHSEPSVGEIDENSVMAIKAAEAVREQRQGRDAQAHGGANVNTHIPSDIARTRLQAMPPSPSSAPRAASPFTSGSVHGGAPANTSPSPVPTAPQQSPVRDFGQVPMMTPPSPLPYHRSYHENQHRHHPHNPHPNAFHLRQHSSPQLTTYAQQSPPHYHNHAPPPLTSIPHSRASPQDFRQLHHLPAYANHLSAHHQTNDDFPPPPAPLAYVDEEELTPPVTPPTPLAQQQLTVACSLEDEFTRELQRQKMEYEQRKKAAEQIRIQQEEKEKDERRRAALKLQEEQRAMMDRQREEQKRESERRQQEEQQKLEQLKLQEQQRLLEEQARQEEEARLREEEARLKEEERLREEARQQEEAQKNKTANKNALSSQSFKEQRRIANSTQYRRTTSDTTTKRTIPTAVSHNTHVDNLNHINRNGVADDLANDQSPGSNLPTQSSKPSSPGAANPSLSRIQTSDRASPASPGARRSKGTERSNVPTPTSGRSVSRTSSTSSVNSVQSQGSTGRATAPSSSNSNAATTARGKNHLTPDTSSGKEEEFKQKHQQVKSQHTAESQRLKSRLEEQRSKGAAQNAMGAKRGTGSESDNRRQTAQTRAGGPAGRSPRSGAVKMLEEYKDANPNFTIRRREEQAREENQQIETLRQTIESRLKVTLPDNLPEALRDGVVLCHLANQIRPRSVASIHVPSPAVPKLTLAKCRRNVENFLDACRKIGVDQEQICLAPDIMDERGVQRVAITVAALVAIGTNPRQSAV